MDVLITNTLYEYAEANSIFSTTQAGFRKEKDLIHQLKNVIMALEDAKLFHKDICAFIVNFISAFNTTDHDRMLWIMHNLVFPTDAIDAVKFFYENATTQVKLPSGVCTGQIPVERGTIQGDTLSPFLFLFYMEPLLRWLHVGGRNYVHTCIPRENELQTHLANNISSASFADDLLCPTGNLKNLKVQANKLTLYSNWAGLNISGSKAKVTGSLNASPLKDHNGLTPSEALEHELTNNILVQNQATKYITPSSPFLYLGVTLTMDLNWKHQHRHMDENLKQKFDALEGSYASPRQTLNIIRTAIIPSLAYAFAVTPCSYPDLDKWDAMIGRVIKSKHNLWRSTLIAMIREDFHSFGLGAPSIYVKYHRRSAVALVTSLEDPSERHQSVTMHLLTHQVA